MLPADSGDREEVPAGSPRLHRRHALAAQLEDEGAKSFVKSWDELMPVIAAAKSAAPAKAS